MKYKVNYAERWSVSADELYKQGVYNWLCEKIKDYKIVLEIGCGTGQSTLALIETGHKVIAIDKNKFCLSKNKKIIENKGYKTSIKLSEVEQSDVVYILEDVMNEGLISVIGKLRFDCVVCWNTGGVHDDNEYEKYQDILMVENNLYEISHNFESLYSEKIEDICCNIAGKQGVPILLATRFIDKQNEIELYYKQVKDMFNFLTIDFSNMKIQADQRHGIILISENKQVGDGIVEFSILSILLK